MIFLNFTLVYYEFLRHHNLAYSEAIKLQTGSKKLVLHGFEDFNTFFNT